MVQTVPQKLTIDEFLNLPETKPGSEFIDGEIIQKPMPQGKHSRLQGKLVTTIDALAIDRPVALAFPELRCSFGGRSIVPDVVVFLYSRIPRDENGEIANVVATYPDWTIEILSPGQSQTRVTSNILHCLNNGSSLGWLIDPDERSVLIFPPNQQPVLLQNEAEMLIVPQFLPQLQLTVGDLLGWLQF